MVWKFKQKRSLSDLLSQLRPPSKRVSETAIPLENTFFASSCSEKFERFSIFFSIT
jgi:hypothetical protein